MRLFVWLIRAFIFFALFAFALNNQQEAAVRWFFGHEWRAPMVIIVLIVFAAGCALGVLAMVPAWWRHRRVARSARAPDTRPAPLPIDAPNSQSPVDEEPPHPPRDGI